MKLEIFEEIKVVIMYESGITILSREDLVMENHGNSVGVKTKFTSFINFSRPNIFARPNIFRYNTNSNTQICGLYLKIML